MRAVEGTRDMAGYWMAVSEDGEGETDRGRDGRLRSQGVDECGRARLGKREAVKGEVRSTEFLLQSADGGRRRSDGGYPAFRRSRESVRDLSRSLGARDFLN